MSLFPLNINQILINLTRKEVEGRDYQKEIDL